MLFVIISDMLFNLITLLYPKFYMKPRRTLRSQREVIESIKLLSQCPSVISVVKKIFAVKNAACRASNFQTSPVFLP